MATTKRQRSFLIAVLCILCLPAFFAANSSAAEIQINGKPALEAEGTGAGEGHWRVLVPGRNLTGLCTGLDLLNVRILSPTELLAKYLFLGCTARTHTTGVVIPCTIGHITLLAIGLPIAIGGGFGYRFHPDGFAETFGTVIMTGESCPLPEENPVKGTFSAKVTTNNSVVDLISASTALSEELKDTLKFGGFAATLSGTSTMELTGAHKGLKFGVA